MKTELKTPIHQQTPMKRTTSKLTQLTQLTRLTLLTLLAALAATGCTVLSYRAPTGERFTRSSLGANTSVSSLTVEAATNGVRRVELHGYQNDSSQALGTVTEAAVRAALQGAK
jgi:hypothetical protein